MIRRLGGAALGVAALAAILLWDQRRGDAWTQLQREVARAGYRATPGRFSDFAIHRPLRITRSAAVSASAAADADEVRNAAKSVRSSAADERQKAVATFLAGRRNEAREQLTKLAKSKQPASVYNDLAVVLMHGGPDDDAPFAALAAAGRALDVDAGHTAARFNRALIIEQLGLDTLAIDAWDDYCRHDGTSEWAAEARERAARIRNQRIDTTAWDDLKAALRSRPAAVNRDRLRRAAANDPQEARMVALNEVLPRWGAAVVQKDQNRADAHAANAAAIGEALLEATGDPAISEIAAAVAADGSQDLASAHVLYGEAAELNAARRVAAAAEKFDAAAALFERRNSPAVLMARYFCATTAVDRGDREAAFATLRSLSAKTPDSYRALRALSDRLRGTMHFFDGLYAESAAAYERARKEFTAIGERQNGVDAASRLAAAVAALGRPADAWPLHRAVLRAAGESGAPRLMQHALHSAAYVAMEEKRWDVAHALLELELAIDNGNPRVRTESHVWRVVAAQRAGLERGVATAMTAARRATAEVTDAGFRDGALNDLRFLEALAVRDERPEQAVELLSEYLRIAHARGRSSRTHDILVERASILQTLGREIEAERDLRDAIALVEERGQRVERDLFRDTFFGRSNAACDALASLLDKRGDVAEAVAIADRKRARILADRTGQRAVSAGVPRVEPGSALLSWGLFSDRTIVYVLRSDGLHRFTSRATTAEIARSATLFVEAIRVNDDAGMRREGKRLYAALLAPAAAVLTNIEKLAIVADTPLDSVPFAALMSAEGRYLIEDVAVTMLPAIRLYHPVPRDRETPHLLSIGDPSIDTTRYVSLSALPAAQQEAREIASMYPASRLLVGTEATRERVLPALQRSSVVHIAAHAVADPSNAENSRILLAETAGKSGSALRAGDIAELDLRSVDLVVLAGCRTSASSASYGFVQNVSAAFLSAGVRDVIGSLWDIDDEAARAFSVSLHRALRSGVEPPHAMRDVQQRMARQYPVRTWASLQLHSTR